MDNSLTILGMLFIIAIQPQQNNAEIKKGLTKISPFLILATFI